jgi:NADH dehydrogenase/NADH:ubiquinone oxidoreductase subunit G
MTLTIDGRPIAFEGRPTLLEVAKANGIFVPSLCEHPGLEPYAACRLCLVEVQGRKGYVPACSTFAEEGLVIRTSTPELVALRRGILELILAEHPHACLICSEKTSCDDFKSTIRKTGEVTGCVLCPANGRCRLQRVVQEMGLDVVPFPSHRRAGEVRRDDPFIDRDNSLCILCGRCVRVCREVRGASVLTFVSRGSGTVVGTALDRRLLDSGCQYCGACVDACPTGSLADRASRYDLLPESEKKIICPLCGQGCGLTIGLREGRIMSSVPDPEGRVNRGQACVRGRFLVRPAVYHPRRLLKPLIREGDSLREATWDEALAFAAARLAGVCPGEVAVAASAQSSCEDIFVLHKFAAEVLKAPALAGAWTGSAAAALRDIGRAAGQVAYPLDFRMADVGLAETILVLGEDLPVSQPIVGLEVHRAVQNGAAVARLAPASSRPSPGNVLELQIPPGKEELFFKALAALALEASDGALKEFSGPVDTTKAARALAIPKKKLLEFSHRLFSSRRSLFLFGPGFSGGDEGLGRLAALWDLARLSGARLVPLDREANTRGGLEIAEAFAARFSRPAERREGAGKSGPRALFIAGPHRKLELGAAELVIVQASYGDENTAAADVVLPEATAFEAAGTLVNIEGRIQVSGPAIAPQGEARPGWWIVTSLAARLGAPDFDYKSAEDVRRDLATAIPAFGTMPAGECSSADLFLVEEPAGTGAFLDGKSGRGRDAERPTAAPRDPDDYKGLNMAREHKSLKLVRGR